MTLLQKLRSLNYKMHKNTELSQDDKQQCKRISQCGSYFYKLQLINMLEYYKEEWSYELLKELTHDRDYLVRKEAVSVRSSFGRREDYYHLYEEVASDSKYVRAAAIQATETIGEILHVTEESMVRRFARIRECEKSDLGNMVLDAEFYFYTYDKKYISSLFRGLYSSSQTMRYWALNLLEEVLEREDNSEEVLDMMEEALAMMIREGGGNKRYVRIKTDSVYSNLMYRVRGKEPSVSAFPLEEAYERKLLKMIVHKPCEETILSYCVLAWYYPIHEYEKAMQLLQNYLWEDWDKPVDKRILIMGAYYLWMFSDDIQNPYLERLLLNIKAYDRKTQAVIYYLLALECSKCLYDLEFSFSLHFLHKALECHKEYPCIYQGIASFSSCFTKDYQKAKKNAKRLEKRMSVEELEKLPVERLYSYEFFYKMEITGQIVKQVDFDDQ